MMKKFISIILLCLPFTIIAAGKKDAPEYFIDDGNNIYKTTDYKSYKLIKKHRGGKIPCYASHKLINQKKIFYITENDSVTKYDFCFYDEESQKDILLYTIPHRGRVCDAYVINNNIYTCEGAADNKITIRKRTVESPEVIKEYEFDFNDTSYDADTLHSLYVDEENNRFIFLLTRKVQGDIKNMKYILHICSMTDCKTLYSVETSLSYLDKHLEGTILYYSYNNMVYKIDYTADVISPEKLETFVSTDKNIVRLSRRDNIFFVMTEYWKFDLMNYLIFGPHVQVWEYYACKLEDNKIKKITKLER